jgi:hypothetical protein
MSYNIDTRNSFAMPISLSQPEMRLFRNAGNKVIPFNRMLFLIGLVSSFALRGEAQTIIPSLPVTLTAPGPYKLTSSLNYNSATGAAINVRASNCTIDLNDYVISNLAAGSATKAIGISAIGCDNLTIRGGAIIGFYIGVDLEGGSGNKEPAQNTSALVQNMRFTYETYCGVFLMQARNAVVRSCQISFVGYDPLGRRIPGAVGIGDYAGPGNLFANNQFCHIAGIGISLGLNDVADNNVFSEMDWGIICSNGSKFKSNTATVVGTPYSGGIPLPGTNF